MVNLNSLQERRKRRLATGFLRASWDKVTPTASLLITWLLAGGPGTLSPIAPASLKSQVTCLGLRLTPFHASRVLENKASILPLQIFLTSSFMAARTELENNKVKENHRKIIKPGNKAEVIKTLNEKRNSKTSRALSRAAISLNVSTLNLVKSSASSRNSMRYNGDNVPHCKKPAERFLVASADSVETASTCIGLSKFDAKSMEHRYCLQF